MMVKERTITRHSGLRSGHGLTFVGYDSDRIDDIPTSLNHRIDSAGKPNRGSFRIGTERRMASKS